MTPEEFDAIIYSQLDEVFRYDTRIGAPQSMYTCSHENFVGWDNFIKTLRNPEKTPGSIMGPVGTGKTHLALGYLRKAIRSIFLDKEVYFEQVADSSPDPATKRLNNIINSVSFISTWRYVLKMKELDTCNATRRHCESLLFLVLDDLGMSRPTDYALDCISNLILARHEDDKKTLVTSNISLEEIDKLFGDRIASRIISFGEVVALTGRDWRINE